MGLFSSLFGSRDRLTDLARQSDPHDFIRVLATADIFVLSVPFESDLDPETTTDEELLADIEAAAEDLANNETGFQPFTFDLSGKSILPFFSTQKLAEEFVQSYVSRVRKIIPFQVLGIQGNVLPSLIGAADSFLLNAETKHETDCTKSMQRLLDSPHDG